MNTDRLRSVCSFFIFFISGSIFFVSSAQSWPSYEPSDSSFSNPDFLDDIYPEAIKPELETFLPFLFFPFDQDANEMAPRTARLIVDVDKSFSVSDSKFQHVTVTLEGELLHLFPVSAGKDAWVVDKNGRKYYAHTPEGRFRVQRMYPEYQSKAWGVTMPWAVFFSGGIAFHATPSQNYDQLGQPASGGCVRLRLEDAESLYHSIEKVGPRRTIIFVHQDPPVNNP